MRIRHKAHARPTLESCPFFEPDPWALRGRWQERFDARRPLHVELGCGKGEFIAALSTRQPEINYLAVDIKDEILFIAKEAVESARMAAGHTAENLCLTAFDIERIEDVLAPADTVQRIYINFPNPWPKARHYKHRLVHERQLDHYLTFLDPAGEIWFRTDDRPLFEDGLAALASRGFAPGFVTYDLLGSAWADYPGSEHQRMFAARGVPICFCVARRV